MKYRVFLVGLISLFAGAYAYAQEPAALATAANVLREANSKVAWDEKTAVVADVTCDGKADTAFIGYEGDMVWLGVVPGSKQNKPRKSMTIRFYVGKHSQDSFCAVPVRIEAYPIECENEDGNLPGCKPVKGCSGFSLVDEACDSFHFYWDSARSSLTWWRR